MTADGNGGLAPVGGGELRVMFRFATRDAALLEALGEEAKRQNMPLDMAGTFTEAARAAARDEPLMVICESLEEARKLAVGYVRYGVTMPTIEEPRA